MDVRSVSAGGIRRSITDRRAESAGSSRTWRKSLIASRHTSNSSNDLFWFRRIQDQNTCFSTSSWLPVQIPVSPLIGKFYLVVKRLLRSGIFPHGLA